MSTLARVLTALVVLSLSVPAVRAGAVTVGRFVQDLAAAKSLAASDSSSAAVELARVGVVLPRGLDDSKILTEKDVATIARAAGLNVTTSSPHAPFNREQVERFFVVFAAELGRGGIDGTREAPGNRNTRGKGPPFDPFAKAKGKGKTVITVVDPG